MAYNFPASPQNIVKIATVNASSQNTVVFTTGFTSAYTYWKVVITKLSLFQGGGSSMLLNFSTNGGSSYDAGANYSYSQWAYDSASGNNWTRAGAASSIFLLNPVPESATATDAGGLDLNLYNLTSAAQYKNVYGIGSVVHATTVSDQRFSGSYNSATAVNAIQFSVSNGGSFIGGTFTFYGYV